MIRHCFAIILVLASLVAAQSTPPAKKSADQAKPPAKEEAAAKPEEAKKPARPRVVTDLSGFDLLDPGKTKKQTMVGGATRGLPHPAAMAPKLGRLYGSSPLFQWSYAGKEQKFVFVLTDDNQNEILRTGVTGLEYRYPGATQLDPGKTYFWTVEPAAALLAEPSSPVGFVVMPAAQRQELEQRLAGVKADNAFTAACDRAQILTDQRLWYDAISAYSDLIAEYPGHPELYEKRGMIYAQLEATRALADEDFARADALRAKP